MAETEQQASGFGRYKDPVMLGQGGMGAVYRAVDPTLDRYVAIKVLTHREPRYVERFRREAQVLAKIQHPSIIQIYEIVGSDEDQSDPYIVMEFCDGRPLDGVLKTGVLAAPEVVTILRQAAEGLKKAHANAVIHRDIKPANLMMSATGEVKILDFGIAKALDAKKDLTGNTVLGTPYYMSPEQAMGHPIDGRTDIYSLGITAFHLLTGKRPFEAKSKVDVMLMQVKNPLPRITDLVECDSRVVEIIEKMCAKQPQARYQNCQELIDGLDALPRALGGKQNDSSPAMTKVLPPPPPKPVSKPVTARPTPATPRPITKPPASVPRQKPRTALFVGLGGGLALVLLAVAYFALRGNGKGAFRVPAQGWVYPGPPAPPLKKLQAQGGYGNCVFSSREIERGNEDSGAVRPNFAATEPIYGRCYLKGQVGPNKAGEIWQDLYVDGVKKAQVIYDPALPNDEDQLAVNLVSRTRDLSPGKHTLDVWIYRQTEDAENPEALAAGELTVRK